MNISSHFVGIGGGLLMSLISFSIVFFVCAGLWAMMVGLKHIAAALERKGTESAPSGAPVQAVATAARPSTPATSSEVTEEVVAVITAAVCAASGGSARIVSIAPAAAGRGHMGSWRMAGVMQNSEGFAD